MCGPYPCADEQGPSEDRAEDDRLRIARDVVVGLHDGDTEENKGSEDWWARGVSKGAWMQAGLTDRQ
jgi:hypothetical protein